MITTTAKTTTTAKLEVNDIVRFGNIVTGFRFATVLNKEKSTKPRWYMVTLQFSNHSSSHVGTFAYSCNTEWTKVNA